MYNESKIDKIENYECLSKGICSVNPALSSLHEVVLLHLKELSFYVLKLNEYGIKNENIKNDILEALFSIVINADYEQEQFRDIIKKLDTNIEDSKVLYKHFCEKNNADIESLKTYFKHSKNFNLTEAIKKGEKYLIKKNNVYTSQQKNLHDLILFLIKSMSIKITELKRLGKENDEYYYSVLSMLNLLNSNEFPEDTAKEEIRKFIKIYYQANVEVFNTQIELYGEITPVDVSFSTTPGKAILVSGSDYKKLELVLKATKDKNIDVYTHGLEMLMTHSLPKLRAFPNLKGHFGFGINTSLIDFAEFPGAILMTKATLQRTEYLYRGRLFTLDPIAPLGIVKIKDQNFEPLIKSALSAKGFVNDREKPSLKVGYSEKEVYKKLDEIIDKIQKNEIKHLYILGLFNYTNICTEYCSAFLDLLPKDCFAISLSCMRDKENILHIDSFYDYSLLYKILNYLNQKIPLSKLKLSIFITRCDKHSIASLIYLKEIGVKNIYMCECPPDLINPAMIKIVQKIFGIKEFSNPKKDIDETLENYA